MEIPPRLFLLLMDCPPGQTAWDCVQSGSEYLHRWRYHVLLLCLTTFIIKKKRFTLHWDLMLWLELLPIASCPISRHYWDESGSRLQPSHQVFNKHTDQIPWSPLFCRLNGPSSICLSSHTNVPVPSLPSIGLTSINPFISGTGKLRTEQHYPKCSLTSAV